MTPPKLGDETTERGCTFASTPEDSPCGARPVVHLLAWEGADPASAVAFCMNACEQHTRPARALAMDEHPFDQDGVCGQRGVRWTVSLPHRVGYCSDPAADDALIAELSGVLEAAVR